MYLSFLADIKTGLFAKPSGHGEVVYLQARYFDENGTLNTELHPDLKMEDVSPKHLLKSGDVLFAAKGSKNFATLFEGFSFQAVASTSFFVIRLVNNFIRPEYLVWYLNSEKTQASLKKNALGTAMPSISKETLERIEVPIPNLSMQDIILEITKLKKKEKQLRAQIEALKTLYMEKTIFENINFYNK